MTVYPKKEDRRIMMESTQEDWEQACPVQERKTEEPRKEGLYRPHIERICLTSWSMETISHELIKKKNPS